MIFGISIKSVAMVISSFWGDWMTFRKNSLLFYQRTVFFVISILLFLAMIPFSGLGLSLLCALPFVVLALVNPLFEKEYIETALYLILTPNTGLFFAFRSIYCVFDKISELAHFSLSLICRLNLL